MLIEINGQKRDTRAETLGEIWQSETEALAPPSRRGFAIAVNGAVVPVRAWDATPLSEGDRIEIIRAMAGG